VRERTKRDTVADFTADNWGEEGVGWRDDFFKKGTKDVARYKVHERGGSGSMGYPAGLAAGSFYEMNQTLTVHTDFLIDQGVEALVYPRKLTAIERMKRVLGKPVEATVKAHLR